VTRGGGVWRGRRVGRVAQHVGAGERGSTQGRCGPQWFAAEPVAWAGLKEQWPLRFIQTFSK
jgi:hypothetical protein